MLYIECGRSEEALNMKKIATFVTALSLALPFAFAAAPLAANASVTSSQTVTAKTAGTTYTMTKKGATFFKKAKFYHTKDKSPVYYKGAFAADSATFTMTKYSTLNSAKTYKVTRSVTGIAKKTHKTQTFLYVKGYGWVKSYSLTKGIFKQAD
ncbi:hypothetical protein KBX59_10295 [Lentilactobacillus hilgardii]|nr:hypothetical protein [Lentilactobacillus hilgardii]MCP9350315.1 hypothetical protein [Lentilactobacillus hilgardii]MCP9353196.1 hypothetical protein [Lentilactobacillus hilgardii]QEU37577.1 hypothetical protein LH500_00650 [Lentilactobacillus hilgardii]